MFLTKNMFQGMDYDPNGDYVRTWVTELANIPGGKQGSSQKKA